MKKAAVGLWVLLAVLAIGFAATADQAWLGNLYLHDYANLWPFGLPEVSICAKPVQGINSFVYVSVTLPRTLSAAWLYVFIEDGLLLQRQLVTCGGRLYQIRLPILYNNGNWKPGRQSVVAVVVPSQFLFNYPNGRMLHWTGAENFTGYPKSGYVIVRKVEFEVCASAPVCSCCRLRCP